MSDVPTPDFPVRLDRYHLPEPEWSFPNAKISTFASDSGSDFPPVKQAPAGAPNILLVLIDDVGFGWPSVNGGLVRMPVAERLSPVATTRTGSAPKPPGRTCAASHPSRRRRARPNHRLNRGGKRQASSAIYRTMLTRMSNDERARVYVARRTAEGKTTGEIARMLKRYIAREVYKTLPSTI